jgi:hypothetical protein
VFKEILAEQFAEKIPSSVWRYIASSSDFIVSGGVLSPLMANLPVGFYGLRVHAVAEYTSLKEKADFVIQVVPATS